MLTIKFELNIDSVDERNAFSIKLENLRGAISKRKIAKMAKVHPANYGKYESGEEFPSEEKLAAICDALKATDQERLNLYRECLKIKLPGTYTAFLDEINRIETRLGIAERYTLDEIREMEASARFSPLINDESALEVLCNKEVLEILENLAEMQPHRRQEIIKSIKVFLNIK